MVRDATLTVTVLGEIVNGVISSKKSSKPKMIKAHFILFSDILTIVDESLNERVQAKVSEFPRNIPCSVNDVLNVLLKIGQKERHIYYE